MTVLQANKMAFERRYSDDSGIEYAVRLDGIEIEIQDCSHSVRLPLAELPWLVGALFRISEEVSERNGGGTLK